MWCWYKKTQNVNFFKKLTQFNTRKRNMEMIQRAFDKFIKAMELSARAKAEQILRDYRHSYRG